MIVNATDGHRTNVLPVEFRIAQLRLSQLPVQLSHIESCSCWSGPRSQAQRKYKFRILNQSHQLINIGGGPGSAIRLIVAYPPSIVPILTLPKPEASDFLSRLETPAGKETEIASHVVTIKPSQIYGSNSLLAVPNNYKVWAIPPTPNEVAEEVVKHGATFPTEVAKDWLLPGEAYGDNRVGYGDWTFYIPVKRQFQEAMEGPVQVVTTPADYEDEVIFVGIGVFSVGGGRVELQGFAPAPSENAVMDASQL